MPSPPVFGFDSPLAPPPPLTSFLGWRSRMMASFRPFLSRRQTDLTTLTFGSSVSLFKQVFPQFVVANVVATTPVMGKLKNCLLRLFQELWKLPASTGAAVCDRRSSKHFLSAISV